VTAFGSAANPDPQRSVTLAVVLTIVLGSLCAALLNAANNILNQVYDLDIDRVNKPDRPIPAGQVSAREALVLSWVLYALAVIPTWLVVVHPYDGFFQKLTAPLERHECLMIYLLGMISTFVYSIPALGRTKAAGIWANITIAIPRGCLLKVAGWSMVASIYHLEPWYIGSIFLLFLVGAASTKDFSDIEGDRAGGCRTLPILYGARRAAQISAPFFVLPWLLIPLGVKLQNPWSPGHTILTGNATILTVLGLVLVVWGAYTSWLMLRNPDELAKTENHPSWTHMYLMMICAQVGFAIGYVY
jgi:4-hydroxybenzoate polyprenyltransferase